ncbi:hypothetical protein Mapa_002476 [Marchantia paleacea]|nr:hypothetical protein Mapa_002476 [Marchantia paleacea]
MFWEENEPGYDSSVTFGKLLDLVSQVSNYLRSLGVKKGDAVVIYMPMLVVLTANGVMLGTKFIYLKTIVEDALSQAKQEGYTVDTSVVFANEVATTKEKTAWVEGRDIWWQDVIPSQSTKSEVEWVDAEDPLFLLYTSGSTGKPKGVLHSTGGYMVYTATTFKHAFDYRPGVPTNLDAGRCWEIVDKNNVTIFYTAPTAIRALKRAGDKPVKKHSRKSLRVLGSPAIVDENGKELHGECSGYLCVKASWPSTFRTLFGDHPRYKTTYYAPFKGYYFSGDGCHRDKDGYYWLTGRLDDVINVSGNKIGSAEVESALVHHPMCAEAIVVGYDHEVKGQGI